MNSITDGDIRELFTSEGGGKQNDALVESTLEKIKAGGKNISRYRTLRLKTVLAAALLVAALGICSFGAVKMFEIAPFGNGFHSVNIEAENLPLSEDLKAKLWEICSGNPDNTGDSSMDYALEFNSVDDVSDFLGVKILDSGLFGEDTDIAMTANGGEGFITSANADITVVGPDGEMFIQALVPYSVSENFKLISHNNPVYIASEEESRPAPEEGIAEISSYYAENGIEAELSVSLLELYGDGKYLLRSNAYFVYEKVIYSVMLTSEIEAASYDEAREISAAYRTADIASMKSVIDAFITE